MRNALAKKGRRPHLTIRGRLTIAFTALFALAGGLMVVASYAFMRYVPHYGELGELLAESQSTDAKDLTKENVTVSTSVITDSGYESERTFEIQDATTLLTAQLVISLVFLAVLVCCGAIASWFIAGRILKPIKSLSHAASEAAEGNLKHRVHLDGPHDEVRQLGDTFDHMLARLDAAFESHKRFASGASHQLQTPLAATKTMIEVAQSDPSPSVPALQDTLARVGQMNDRSIETVGALLDLAAIEQGVQAIEEVDLNQVLSESLSLTTAEATARDLTVSVERAADVETTGSPVLIGQMVVNLLQNAVRHNVPSGTIHVELSADPAPVLSVTNTGDVIEADRLKQLTEPFAQGRNRTAKSGHGLGLAIVQSIADASNAELRLVANPGGGLCATVFFPS